MATNRMLADAILGRMEPVIADDPAVLNRYATALQYFGAATPSVTVGRRYIERAAHLQRIARTLPPSKG